MMVLTRTPKLSVTRGGDASSPQCGCDAPVAFFQTSGKTTYQLATKASLARFCDGESQPRAGQLRSSGLRKFEPRYLGGYGNDVFLRIANSPLKNTFLCRRRGDESQISSAKGLI